MSPLTGSVIHLTLTVVGTFAVAALVLYGAKRFGSGAASGPIELLGRQPLEARRAVYVVRVGDRAFVIGGSEAGLEKIGELPAQEVDGGEGRAVGGVFGRKVTRLVTRRPLGDAPSIDRDAG